MTQYNGHHVNVLYEIAHMTLPEMETKAVFTISNSGKSDRSDRNKK